jgi:hypothetical protein
MCFYDDLPCYYYLLAGLSFRPPTLPNEPPIIPTPIIPMEANWCVPIWCAARMESNSSTVPTVVFQWPRRVSGRVTDMTRTRRNSMSQQQRLPQTFYRPSGIVRAFLPKSPPLLLRHPVPRRRRNATHGPPQLILCSSRIHSRKEGPTACRRRRRHHRNVIR